MQLRRFFLFLIITSSITITAAIWSLNVQVAEWNSPDLRRIPLGYEYKSKPLTGLVYEFYPGKKLAKLGFLYKGKRQGPEIYWYNNGQRWVERHYQAGLDEGIHKVWYADGKVKSLKHFIKGVPHGEFYEWHDNGNIAQFIEYDHGKEIVAKSWTGGGKPFYNYVWRDGTRIGLEGDTYCSPKRLNN